MTGEDVLVWAVVVLVGALAAAILIPLVIEILFFLIGVLLALVVTLVNVIAFPFMVLWRRFR